MQKKIIVLKKGREKSVLNRHPWIFSGAVAELPYGENGEIISVFSSDKKWLGYGFLDPSSQIICRLFEFSQEEIDVTSADYWYNKIKQAFDLRKKYIIADKTNCFRLIHAEGDFFPGLIIDIYDSVAVIQLLIKGTEKIKDFIIDSLKKIGFYNVYLKNKISANVLEKVTTENGWLVSKIDSTSITVKENGFQFKIDIEKGQKTGFFIDQRENRKLVKEYSAGKNVLNAFSYTGGFSVYACAGNASRVDSVDSSKDASLLCDENIRLNFGERAPHHLFTSDVFEFLRQTTSNYDLMIIDPPAFAKNARSVPNAARGYKDLNHQCFKKINKEGILFTFSCSQHIDRDLFRKIIFSAAADARRDVQILHQLTQPIDHPISIYHPEGEYLKGLVLKVS